MEKNIAVTISNTLSELENVRQAVERFYQRNALPERHIYEVLIATEEIVANIISYAYEPAEQIGRRITIRASLDEREMVVQVSDDGNAFNPLENPAPDLAADLAERQIGGLGIHFVRRLMTDVDYERSGERNIVTLRKRYQ